MYSSPLLVLKCLQDNFSTLLDRQLHTSRGLKAGHSEYDSEVRAFHGWQNSQQIFYHKNPKKIDSHYIYLQRCVCRFRGLLQSEGRKLFLLMLLNQTKQLDKQPMHNLIQQLDAVTSNTSELLVVFHQQGKDFNMRTESEDNLTFLFVVSTSRCGGSGLVDLEEERALGQKIGMLYNYNIVADGSTKDPNCTCQPPCNKPN
jgi:hypothetical protein